MSISLKTHKMLWGRSGGKCSFPDCKRILIEDKSITDGESIVGQEAHIIAKEIDGPRGNSELPMEKRDEYDNLILLCGIHHKLIDDQPNTYTMEVLRKMKESQELAYKNTSPDMESQKDEEIYASYIDKWSELADVYNWNGWSSYILSSGQPKISEERYDKLKELNEYILSRIWPGRHPKLEFAFNNFRLILNDFIKVFSMYMEKIGSEDDPWYITEKIYQRLDRWDPPAYNRLAKQYEYHVDLVEDLMCELTRAGNYLCDQIRKYISPSFRIDEGVLLLTSGPHMDLTYKTFRVTYTSDNDIDCKYPGLREFMKIRKRRDRYFGEGISEDYFPPL